MGVTRPVRVYIAGNGGYRDFVKNNFYDFYRLISFHNFPKKEIIQSFVTYSKLKALYLSNNIPDKTELKSAITKLCSVKNIKSVFNADKKNKGEYEISDFYFLVSHVFFASYKKLALNHNTPNGGNYYDISARLNFGMGRKFDDNSYGYRQYQYYC